METSDARKRRVETSSDQGDQRGGESRSKAAFCVSGGTNYSDVIPREQPNTREIDPGIVRATVHPEFTAFLDRALEDPETAAAYYKSQLEDAQAKIADLRAEITTLKETWQGIAERLIGENNDLYANIARVEALADEWAAETRSRPGVIGWMATEGENRAASLRAALRGDA